MEATPRKPVGGIGRVILCPAAAVERVDLDGAGRCSAIVLRPGAEPLELPLVEERSCYTEQTVADSGPARVCHRLQVGLSHWQGRALFDARFLACAASDGFVARIGTLDGGWLLAGWSHPLGTEQPLRLETLRYTTGTRRADAPAAELTLVSADGAPALACPAPE